MRITQATPSRFRAEDETDTRFSLLATLRSGVLRFQVVAQLRDGTRGAISGREFFDAMMSHFGVKIRVIEGHWTRISGLTTNLDLFNQAIAAGLTSEQAALVATKTGRWADDYRFSQVTKMALDPPNAPGNYVEVIVQFSK